MVWVRTDRPTYHLLHSCPLLVAPNRGGAEDQAPVWLSEAEAKRRGLGRCHHCYGSRGRTA